MSVTFNRPPHMKYTDMCIYIDKHQRDIKNIGEHPDVETRIFEYIYHVIYALACKSGYFKNFEDYDSYSIYAAGEIFISMRRKLEHEGEVIRGKEVKPIKSILNFIKATMFPLKVNYQNENFNQVLNPKIDEEVDELGAELKENIQHCYQPDTISVYTEVIQQMPGFFYDIIHKESPFRRDQVMCQRLYLSAILTLLNDITIPNKLRKRVVKPDKLNEPKTEKELTKISRAYELNEESAILWHLEEGFTTYVRLLVTKAKKKFSRELEYYIHQNDLSDELLDAVMKSAYSTYEDEGDSNE